MLYIILTFIIGACAGSAVNCLVERKISDRDWWRGRSACPHCGRNLRWYELIPVVSFIIQGGRCRACHEKLRWQYLLSEISLGVFFALAWSRAGVDLNVISAQNFWPFLIVARDWLMLCFLAAIFWYDYRQQLIPDAWVVLGGALALSFNIFLGVHWWQLLIGAGACAGFLGAQYVVSRGRWIGLGDVKLGVFLGLLVGWPQVAVLILLTYIMGGLVGTWLLARRRAGLKSAVALGPFLTLAAAITLLYGQNLLEWYLRHLGL